MRGCDMSCLPCFGSKESESKEKEKEEMPVAQTKGHPSSQSHRVNITTDSPSVKANNNPKEEDSVTIDINETADEVAVISARNFGFRELAMATKNFRRETLLGESRAGKVYKGTLQGSGQIVAVKQLDRHGTKANKEFLAEVMMLSLLRHPNLAELIGYCGDGDQRILVYEFMESGSLKERLHEGPPEREPLDWITRMKIASGSAQALEYLHEKANPPILYRNFASTKILLHENMEPKLTDYGLVRFEIDSGNNVQQKMVSTVTCAPEYEQRGELTPKSDVYSFGVVLLELITGRKPLDTTLPFDEQNLVTWAQPYFREPKRFPEMVDPKLKGAFPDKSLNQAVGVAAMCVQDDSSVRPMMSDVVAALSFLTMPPPPQPQPQPQPVQPELESESESESEPEPQPQPQSSVNIPASTDDLHEETHSSPSSSSSSSSSLEEQHKQELEAGRRSIEDDSSEDISSSDTEYEYDDEDEDEDEDRLVRIKSNKPRYDEDRGGGDTSSSESLYDEDDYGEDEDQQEETSYRSKSKPKSIKRKVTFEKEKRSVSRNNSSQGNNKSFKTQSGSSMRKKSVNRKSSRNNVRIDDIDSYTSNKKGVDSKSLEKNDQNISDPYGINDKLSSKISQIQQDVNGESSDSSFSSDDSESSIQVVDFSSARRDMSGWSLNMRSNSDLQSFNERED